MKGNLYTPVPLSDMTNALPQKLGERYRDSQGNALTWNQLVDQYREHFGWPLLVKWTDGNKYVVVELNASFMTGEMDEIQALRLSTGIQVGDLTSAAYGRLLGSEVSAFLSQIDPSDITIYKPL